MTSVCELKLLGSNIAGALVIPVILCVSFMGVSAIWKLSSFQNTTMRSLAMPSISFHIIII